MPCYHLLTAFQTSSGSVVFHETPDCVRELQLPCGRCIGCRLSRSRSWAIRCMHESQMHRASSFVTLTYEHDYVPSLEYRDFQLFMKRLRKAIGPTRFFAVGEYGAELGRPHFHALLFGAHFADRKKHTKTLFRSELLSRLWPHGFGSIGNVTFQSAAYCARYCCEKVTGPMADEHYRRVDLDTGELVSVVPEFAHMSLKPGIGYPWFLKFWKDVYLARDGVVIGGKTLPAPKYYDRLLEASCPEMRCDKDFDRYVRSKEFEADCTPRRLVDREIVAKARLSQLRRI